MSKRPKSIKFPEDIYQKYLDFIDGIHEPKFKLNERRVFFSWQSTRYVWKKRFNIEFYALIDSQQNIFFSPKNHRKDDSRMETSLSGWIDVVGDGRSKLERNYSRQEKSFNAGASVTNYSSNHNSWNNRNIILGIYSDQCPYNDHKKDITLLHKLVNWNSWT